MRPGQKLESVLPKIYPDVPKALDGLLFHGIVDSAKITADDIEALLEIIVQRGLAALTLGVAQASGVSLPESTMRILRESQFDWSQQSSAAEFNTASALTCLEEAGIPFVVMKGPTMAVLYKTRWWRPFSDIDIMVPRRAFRATVDRLQRTLGYREAARNRMPRRHYDAVCREAINLESPHGGKVDVHHHLPPWLWSRAVTYKQLARNARGSKVGGIAFPSVCPEDNLMISALHIVSDRNRPGWNLLCWRDIAFLASTLDENVVAARAVEYELAGWLAWVLSCLPEQARPSCLIETVLAASGDAAVPHVRRLRALVGGSSQGEHIATQTLRLPLMNAGAFTLIMVAPSCEFLYSKYGSNSRGMYRHWWREGLRGVSDVAAKVR